MMQFKGVNQSQTIQKIAAQYPEITGILGHVKKYQSKRALDLGQAAFLYGIVKTEKPAAILEIGTSVGFSASIMAEAAPQATMITLNPDHQEVKQARKNLSAYKHVQVIEAFSWDYIHNNDQTFDLIFVDGDHDWIQRDLAWFSYLAPNGVIVFHDYSPAGTYRECPTVYQVVNDLKYLLGREPEYILIDKGNVGMVGFRHMPPSIPDPNQVVHASFYSSCSQAYLEGLYGVASHLPKGIAVECGVKHGGSAAVMALGSQRMVQLFDSFKGYNPPLPIDGGRAAMKFERPGWGVGDFYQVQQLFNDLGLDDPIIHSGQFVDTIPSYNGQPIALLHLDCSFYEPTKLCLEHLYPFVVSGGMIVAFGFHYWEGVRAAIQEFWGDQIPTYLPLDKISIYWSKP